MEIFAARPSALGHTAHLHVPGYQPGKKTRPSADRSPLCGSSYSVNPDDVVLLSLALQNWPNPVERTELREPFVWSWCKSCIGHAVALAGQQRSVLHQVVAATFRPLEESA